jgi:hypothetical protein
MADFEQSRLPLKISPCFYCLFLVCGLASSGIKNFPCVLYGDISLFLGLAWVSFRNGVLYHQ